MDMLDERDRKLLAALKENARASLVSLARDIDLSRSATHDRITRLEEKGVIEGYTIVQKQSSSPQIKAFLTVTLDPSTRDIDVAAKIAPMDGVTRSYCLAGDIDMLIECEIDTMDELSELRKKAGNIPGILTVHTRMVLHTQSA